MFDMQLEGFIKSQTQSTQTYGTSRTLSAFHQKSILALWRRDSIFTLILGQIQTKRQLQKILYFPFDAVKNMSSLQDAAGL